MNRYALVVGKLCCVLATIEQGHAISQEVKISAPVRCMKPLATSCGADITYDEALAEHKKMKDRQPANCETNPKFGLFSSHCGPHVSATQRNICGDLKARGYDYFWASPNELVDGNKSLNVLLEEAKSGKPFGTDPKGLSHLIVASSNSAPSEVHLALCSAEVVGTSQGPPRDCVSVGIIKTDGALLRATWDDGIESCMLAAEFRITGAIGISFDVSTALRATDFTKSLINILQSELALVAEQRSRQSTRDFVSITSVAGLRLSQVLPGKWWEAVDFDINLEQIEKEKLVRVYGVAHISVAGQPLGSLTQYQGLDDAQKQVYADKLQVEVSKGIKAACKEAVQQDAKNIICH